ncbi:uncharacterized protein LOC125859089 [Solanum stenotomum]|uniref:uncharacterized protein LOC125859089 n=1 Tax=Solanum stenotomum TaxID=172797 RepID=UPI0020D13226|nr:uncharacterized protein LOC125859089 [Solanum stenotomum]
MPDLGLLRCVNAEEASTIMIEVHSGVCGPHMNEYVLAKQILRAGYRTTVRTSVGATPYSLVYGSEAVIPAEVEIPSLQIVVEAKIDDDEWIRTRLEQLSLIDDKRLTSVCHGQLYQKRMAQAYNKKVRPRRFEEGQLVLRRILPHQAEVIGKFSPNWKGPFIVKNVLSNDALYLADIEGKMTEMVINADDVKRYCI